MCHKLISTYACNHSKIICTTPCPYALETGRRIPRRIDNDQGLSRTDSTVSSLAPSILPDNHPAQLRSAPPSRLSLPPPTVPSRASPQPTERASVPAFRFIPSAPSPSQIKLPADYSSESPAHEHSSHNSPSAALLPDEQFDIDPNFCSHHFPRNLPKSRVPCKECYMLPEWEHLAPLYMKSYYDQHPMVKLEDVESLAGIKDLREAHVTRLERGV